MRIIYSVKDPLLDIIKYDPDICIKRNVNMTEMSFYKFFYNSPDIITNIKWKTDCKYKDVDYLTVKSMNTYPKDLTKNIIQGDLVYFNCKLLRFVNYIENECCSFKQLIDELNWYQMLCEC